MYDIDAIRRDFPILSREVNGKPLVYLDNGASAQKPQVVIDAITTAYAEEYANVHRGLHYLSNLATEKYEGVRWIIARFLGVADEDQIVLNSGTTEGINMVAYGWAMPRMEAGDEIVLSVMEHHANIVPWHFLRERQGVALKWVDTDSTGALDPQKVIDAIGPKTKLVALTHLSNVLGTKVDIKAITDAAHEKGVPVLVDGSQAAVHMPVNLDELGVDFYAITGHKLYGPSGSGAIFVKKERLAEMRPFMGGGDMIREVSKDEVTYADPPMKFEAGTPGIVQTIGLGVALAAPDRKVFVLDGDGSLLMNLGSLATIARQRPPNLVHIVWDNHQWAETGGQPTHTAAGTDLAAIARGAGIPHVAPPSTLEAVEEALDRALREEGPGCIVAEVEERGRAPRPSVEIEANLLRFRATFA